MLTDEPECCDDWTALQRMMRETERSVWETAVQEFWERMGACEAPRLTTWRDHASACAYRAGGPCDCPARDKDGGR